MTMKKMKKIFALLVAVTMLFALNSTVFAASIDVQNVIDKETYTAYKILNYTDNGATGTDRKVTYYLSAEEYGKIGKALEDVGFSFTKSADGTQYVVNNGDKLDPADAASKLASADLGEALGKFTAIGKNGKAEFSGLTPGYYFVTTTAGSLCALHEDKDLATVVEKNTVTTGDKKQGSEAGTYSDEQLDMNIGDTVYYSVDIKIGAGANQDVILTDTMDKGLTLDTASIKVQLKGADVAATNYKVENQAERGFKLTLPADYVKTLKEGDVVTVTYEAVINQDAVIHDKNNNTATIEYSNQTQTDTTVVKTYDAELKKVDEKGDALSGAEFKLYDSNDNALKFTKDTTGYVLDATNGKATIETGDGTGVNIRGLAPGTYSLEETKAPAGYNKLGERIKVTVEKDATSAVEITVENKAGSELPSTGGMGTRIFYVLGGLLVIGAGIVLVTRRRMNTK